MKISDLESLFGEDTCYFVATSRSHMKEKEGLPPDERFHVYFPHRKFTSVDEVTEFKRRLYDKYPFFDGNALDASRMIFGNPDAEIIWHEGIFFIEDVMTPSGDDEENQEEGCEDRSSLKEEAAFHFPEVLQAHSGTFRSRRPPGDTTSRLGSAYTRTAYRSPRR